MFIKKIAVAAVAALGLSLGAYSASAAPQNDGAPAPLNPQSTFTLIRAGGGGHMGGGGGHMGGHMGGMGGHFGGMGGMRMGGMRMGAGPRMGGRYAFAGGRVAGGRYAGGRTVFYHGRRGYWRGGRFFPFFGIYAGGSCYWNCRAQGFGPGYCSAYAYNFCY